jgi:prepilin-type N-terminal cleavage/methylation domain-containing protein/prepilin-type processing-associated H-X9-DG protein
MVIFNKQKLAGSRPKSLRSFTLIELLVVVAIISVLIAILLPALGKAKAKMNALTCMTHLKGLGTAGLMYMNDNNGKAPAGFQYLWDSGRWSYIKSGQSYWLSRGAPIMEGFAKYTRPISLKDDKTIWICPTDYIFWNGQLRGRQVMTLPSAASFYMNSYTYNDWINENILADSPPTSTTWLSDMDAGRHRDGERMVLFLDGHVYECVWGYFGY